MKKFCFSVFTFIFLIGIGSIGFAAVGQPAPSEPLSGLTTNYQTPTFIWTGISTATAYYLQLSTNDTFANLISVSTGTSNSLYISTSTLAGTTFFTVLNDFPLAQNIFYWRVSADSGTEGSFSGWSSTSSVIVDTTPPTAVLLSTPSNNCNTSQWQDIQFIWFGSTETLSGIKNYTLQLSTASDFSKINYSSITANTQATLSLVESSYTWRVNVEDNVLNYATSTVRWTLVVDITSPTAVDLLLNPPDNYATNYWNINFVWGASTDTPAGIKNYILQLSKTTDFSLINYSSITVNTQATLTLVESSYTWRVNAEDNALNYTTSTVVRFTLIVDTTLPTAVLLSTPSNNCNTSQWQDIQFIWSGSTETLSGIKNYILQLSTASNFSKINYSSITVNTQATLVLVESSYTWRVNVQDNALNYTTSTARYTLILGTSPPHPPTLVWPINNQILTAPTTIFFWSPAADPDHPWLANWVSSYTVTWGTNPNFTLGVIGNPTTDYLSLSYLVTGLVEDTTHWWKVESKNILGRSSNEIAISSRSFRFDASNQLPNPFDLLSPTGTVIISSSAPLFSWEDKGDPDPWDRVRFQIDYSRNSNFSSPISSAGLAVPNFSATADLVENATYWWRVAAFNYWDYPSSGTYVQREGSRVSNSTGTFRANATNEPPNPFNLRASSGIVYTSSVSLDWDDAVDPDPKSIPGTISYTVFWSTNSNFGLPYYTSPLGSLTNVSQYTITSGLVENTTHYWKVMAEDNDIPPSVTWSSTWTFVCNSTNSAPTSFQLVASSGIVTTRRPRFDWADSSDPDPGDSITYTLWCSSSSSYDLSTGTQVVGLRVSSYTPTAYLIENATYWWSVRAIEVHPAGNPFPVLQIVSSTWTFRIDQSTEPPNSYFDLESPANNSISFSSAPVFTWRAAIDPNPRGGGEVKYNLGVNYITPTPDDSNWKDLVSSITVTSAATPVTSPNPYSPHWDDFELYWRVKAYGSDVSTWTYSPAWTLRVDWINSPPSTFTLLSPANGEVVFSSTPLLTWESSSGSSSPDSDKWDTVKYKVEYTSANADFTISVSSAEVTVSSYSVQSALTENATYWWRVTAEDYWDKGLGEGLERRRENHELSTVCISTFVFCVNASSEPPRGFQFRSPERGIELAKLKSSKRPTFDWDDTVDVDPGAGGTFRYTIYYSTGADFSPDATIGTTTIVSSYSAVSALFENTTYYWKVSAINGTNLVTWATDSQGSTTSYFHIPIIDRPREPSGVRGNLNLNLNLFVLSWSSVTKNTDDSDFDDRAGYNVYRSSDFIQAGVTPLFMATTAYLSWTDTDTSKVYYYLVRAVDTSGIESEDSMIVNSRGDVFVRTEKISISIPKEVSDILYQANNSYGSDLKIAISTFTAGTEVQGTSYTLRILRADNLEEVPNFAFSKAVELKFTYEKSGGQSAPRRSSSLGEGDVAVLWNNGVEYVNLGGTVDTQEKTISVSSKYVGRYLVQKLMRATSFEITKRVPTKIFTPDGQGPALTETFTIYCANPKMSTVEGEIYDITGAYIADLKVTPNYGNLTTELVWDGKDKEGNLCRDGVYIYQIKSDGKTINGTVVLAK